MIRAYKVRQSQQERYGCEDDQLEQLCNQFAQTSTREEVVDGVGNLLAHLDIARDSGNPSDDPSPSPSKSHGHQTSSAPSAASTR
jgi:hypothetical protein